MTIKHIVIRNRMTARTITGISSLLDFNGSSAHSVVGSVVVVFTSSTSTKIHGIYLHILNTVQTEHSRDQQSM